jgi:glutathione S-transferase
MKLYGFPASPNTWKVLAVAHHLGIPLDLVFVDLTKGAQRESDYLALNPTGRTPTLVDGDLKLWESTAIMQYLASQQPSPLFPNDARTRADIMRWQSWSLMHWGKEGCEPLLFQRLVKKIMNMGPPDEAVVAKGCSVPARATMLDAHRQAPYLTGAEVTLPISRSWHRSPTARKRSCRSSRTGTSRAGSDGSLRCRPGARQHHSPRRPRRRA